MGARHRPAPGGRECRGLFALGAREDRGPARPAPDRRAGRRDTSRGARARARSPPGEPVHEPRAVDVTPVRPGDEAMESHALKTNLPHGWDYTAVFGVGQGATDAPVHLMMGLLTLLLAAALAAAALRTSKI